MYTQERLASIYAGKYLKQMELKELKEKEMRLKMTPLARHYISLINDEIDNDRFEVVKGYKKEVKYENLWYWPTKHEFNEIYSIKVSIKIDDDEYKKLFEDFNSYSPMIEVIKENFSAFEMSDNLYQNYEKTTPKSHIFTFTLSPKD